MRRLSQLLILLVCVLAPLLAHAQRDPVTLNPKTYTSPAGVYSCVIDPTDRDGAGAGNYLIKKNGRKVWDGKKPFTLYDARITDEGIISGYAYTYGYEGYRENAQRGDYGELLIVIMRANGEIILNKSIKREFCGRMHWPPTPIGKELVASGGADSLLISLDTCGEKERQSYQLTTGKTLIMPTLNGAGWQTYSLNDLHPVAGTSLYLFHTFSHLNGGHLVLLDKSLQAFWNLDMPKDHQLHDDRKLAHNTEVILDTSKSNMFSIFSAGTTEKITFEIASDSTHPNKWIVKEADRQPYLNRLDGSNAPPVFPTKTLKHLGTILLEPETKKEKSPVRDVICFDLDDSDRFGLIRIDDEKKYSFVLVAADGKVMREISLPLGDEVDGYHAPLTTWIENDRWLITASNTGAGAKSKAWWLDTKRGDIKLINEFASPPITKICGLRDGSFIALTEEWGNGTVKNEAIAVDNQGHTRSHLGGKGFNNNPASLLSPTDIAVTPTGEMALLDNIRGTVQFFDLNGDYQKTWKLESFLKRKPNYPTLISTASNGDFAIYDFNAPSPMVRLNRNGKLLSQTKIYYADGKIVDHIVAARINSTGALWISDGTCLASLNQSGAVSQIFGDPPDTKMLDYVAGATVDQKGIIYLADGRTGTVHIYDASGKPLRKCEPLPGDFSGHASLPHIAVTKDGDVYFQPDSMQPFIHYAPDGSRVGIMKLKLGFREELYTLPKGKNQALVLSYKKAYLTTPDREKVHLIIDRGPDNRWLERMTSASVASDGTFAIAAGSSYGNQHWWVHLYDAKGRPIRTVTMPKGLNESGFLYTGKYLVAHSDTVVHLLTAKGKPVLKFSIPNQKLDQENVDFFAPYKGKELWVLDRTDKTIQRYMLP